ncbi:MAG: hypothetical protein WBL95_01665 [Microcoleus sp.]
MTKKLGYKPRHKLDGFLLEYRYSPRGPWETLNGRGATVRLPLAERVAMKRQGILGLDRRGGMSNSHPAHGMIAGDRDREFVKQKLDAIVQPQTESVFYVIENINYTKVKPTRLY